MQHKHMHFIKQQDSEAGQREMWPHLLPTLWARAWAYKFTKKFRLKT